MNWMEALSLGATLMTQMFSMVYLTHPQLDWEITILLSAVNLGAVGTFAWVAVRLWWDGRKDRVPSWWTPSEPAKKDAPEIGFHFNPMLVQAASQRNLLPRR